MKPTLKAPGTNRLKLKPEEPLSSFAFKFNLRRYSEEDRRLQFEDELRGQLVTLMGGRAMPAHFLHSFLLTFVEPQGASHGELNQPSPQCHADRGGCQHMYTFTSTFSSSSSSSPSSSSTSSPPPFPSPSPTSYSSPPVLSLLLYVLHLQPSINRQLFSV